MGERDIEKKLLDLPIPRFDNENFRYLKLANLGLQAEKEVGEILCEIDLPKPLGLKRKALREGISRTLDSIDEVVAQILVI